VASISADGGEAVDRAASPVTPSCFCPEVEDKRNFADNPLALGDFWETLKQGILNHLVIQTKSKVPEI
jgi:hypothetical protein